MAKAKPQRRKLNRIDVQNLTDRDNDILRMETKDVMNKYKLEKQAVYDRRFALNTKLKAAGMTIEIAGENNQKNSKTRTPKRGSIKKPNTAKPAADAQPIETVVPESREVMVMNKQIPVILKPIEITFDNFSIKLNGVPKRISVNPETNAIEIDL